MFRYCPIPPNMREKCFPPTRSITQNGSTNWNVPRPKVQKYLDTCDGNNGGAAQYKPSVTQYKPVPVARLLPVSKEFQQMTRSRAPIDYSYLKVK
jgi:hypothetical protein